jgi:tetratricopeptide (TPR) repeat protein
MKTIKFLLPLLLLFTAGCKQKKSFKTNAEDYNTYLDFPKNENYDLAKEELKFWGDKYKAAPNQVTYLSKMAAAHSSLFEVTGDIEHLYKTEEYLKEVNNRFEYGSASSIRTLARNYISQHRFRESLELLEKAAALGEGKSATDKMFFDVQMELGNYKAAEKKLTEIRDEKKFDYLIRLAKWYDHKGDLDGAILNMERATQLAEKSKNEALKLWAYSNIADFYGHAGRLQDSYNNYLKVLEIDPNYSYALKGIAWITFSHERNSKEALRIINTVSIRHNTPDYLLFKAEIAEFNGKDKLKNDYLAQYFGQMEKKEFGEMYNSYNAKLFADQPSSVNKAITLAEREISNRPTPQSYDLLAWAYLKSGQKEKALKVAQQHIEGKTYEPEAAYHLAEIYAANGQKEKSKSFKSELLASVYELGPNTEKAIQKL